MKKLYRFYCDCGRMGDLESIFVQDEDVLKEAIGKRVYFGEVLGKHSEIIVILEEGYFTELTDDQDFIAKAVQYGLGSTGHNPFGYMEDE